MGNNKYNFCVIGAEVNNIEQRLLLSGIIAEAQKKSIGIIVLSNLYNDLNPEKAEGSDNRIYELIADIRADAFIILSESFVNPALSRKIHDLLISRRDVPAIIVGTELPGFEQELFPCINTSDEKDMETIVDKLIEENGFTRISLLTGPPGLEPSRSRADGYRRSLEKHGITYDERQVYEGDFWYNSGEQLAGRYISGEIPYPQALVCANDYMAFGVLDACSAAGIDITGHMALVGYEYIPERSLHKPLLTTYQRNRNSLGTMAVDILYRRLMGENVTAAEPPQGVFISGQTCQFAGPAEDKLQEELVFLRTQNQYAVWNLKSEMESRLTECRNYDEFLAGMGEELFIVRYARDVVLCLFENWFRENEIPSDTLICRNANKYAPRGDIVLKVSELHKLADHFPDMAVFYFNPVFFKERLLGYCAVMYDEPDTYDDTYRHWLKSVSNGLEFLRLKTDIDFLLQCNTLSASYDSLTGLFSAEGLRSAFLLMNNSERTKNLTAAAVRLVCDKDAFIPEAESKMMISRFVSAAKNVKRFCGNNGIAGRVSEFELLLIYPADDMSADILADAVYTEIVSADGADRSSVLCCGRHFSGGNTALDDIRAEFSAYFDGEEQLLKEKRNSAYYQELEMLCSEMAEEPLNRYTLGEVSGRFDLNPNYFNRICKRFYGKSFNQFQIELRVGYAKHLLISTELPVAVVSEKCGYSDSKYFIKQFASVAGLSPAQYRSAILKHLI